VNTGTQEFFGDLYYFWRHKARIFGGRTKPLNIILFSMAICEPVIFGGPPVAGENKIIFDGFFR
jgi:hypothetical protein